MHGRSHPSRRPAPLPSPLLPTFHTRICSVSPKPTPRMFLPVSAQQKPFFIRVCHCDESGGWAGVKGSHLTPGPPPPALSNSFWRGAGSFRRCSNSFRRCAISFRRCTSSSGAARAHFGAAQAHSGAAPTHVGAARNHFGAARPPQSDAARPPQPSKPTATKTQPQHTLHHNTMTFVQH